MRRRLRKTRAFAGPLLAALVLLGVVFAPARAATETRSPWWVFLADKGPGAPAPGTSAWDDAPVYPPYVAAVAGIASPRHESRWFNAVSVDATAEEVDSLAALPFVREVQPVGRTIRPPEPESTPAPSPLSRPTAGPIDYGLSATQIRNVAADSLHALDLTGQGVVVAVLDEGFINLTHPAISGLTILGSKDFVDRPYDTNVTGLTTHGTAVLSILAGNAPGNLVGPAYNVDVLLARTENDSGGQERRSEEDNWVAGIEWATANGADIVTSSVGYNWFDNPADDHTLSEIDGKTTVITRAAQKAAGKGVVVLNAMGNERGVGGNPNWLGRLIFPADGDSVIAVGATTTAGNPTSFTSFGPTADGRIKPDVSALGSSVRLATATFYEYGSGTSYSTPLVAGVVALLREAHPTWDPIAMRTALRMSGSRALNPDTTVGWGVINGVRALGADRALFGRLVDSTSGAPVAGSRVRVTPTSGTPGTTTTSIVSAAGWFGFEHVPPGTYRVEGLYPDSANASAEIVVTLPRLPREIHLRLGSPTGIHYEPHPEPFWVGMPFPNPANPSVRIPWALREAVAADRIDVEIVAANGQVVRRFAIAAAAFGTIAWDGRDESGLSVASGTYVARLSVPGRSSVARKFVLAR